MIILKGTSFMSENTGTNEMPEIKIKRAQKKPDNIPPHDGTYVKKIIGVVSGKGGVGKSLVTSLLAVNMNNHGFQTSVLDADITGPSIPRAFGLSGQPMTVEDAMLPLKSKGGIDIMSINFLLKKDTEPVIWRGPVISGAVSQFWTDVIWGKQEFMFIDMPPGTGDVALTVFQSIPIDGIIVVTSPQELVGMIVEKAVNMAEKMDIPVLGLVENMSYAVCPKCGEKINVFGESHLEEIADKFGIKTYCRIPFDSRLAEMCDNGTIEDFPDDNIHAMVKMLRNLVPPECGC